MRRTLLMALALIVAGCQLIVPPSPIPAVPGLPFPSAGPPRLSPSIEIPPPP